MKNKKKQVRLVLGIIALCLLVASGGYLAYKRTASADVWGTVPSWIDAQTANNVNNVWSTSQKQIFFGCSSNGFPVKSTLTSSEIQKFGSNSVAFEGQQNLPNDQWFQTKFYQSRYRIIVTPVAYYTENNTTKAKFRFTIKNPTNDNNYLKLAQIRLGFWRVTGTDPAGTPSYGAADEIVNVVGNVATTLAPGQEITVESKLVPMIGEPAYYTLDFSSELFSFENNQVTSWNGYGSGSPVFCIVNPIALSALKTMNLPPLTNTSVVPNPSPSPSVAPTISQTTGTDLVLHRGFNAVGSSVPIDKEYIASNGLHIYDFAGNWLIYPAIEPNPPLPETRAFRGYYIFSPEQKTIRLNYNMVLPVSFPVENGWNLLWTPQGKNLDSLLLNISGTVKTAQTWINDGKLHDKIFLINDDTATQACNYFSILSRTSQNSNCATGTPASITSIPAGKSFWVYVK